MEGRFFPPTAQVWAWDLLAQYRTVSAGLCRPYLPAKYTMHFPKGYNAPSLKQENLTRREQEIPPLL